MPKLVKGDKHIYGWSKVSSQGKIVIPNKAVLEYNLLNHDKVFLMSGSKRSGGFCVTSAELLGTSVFSAILAENPQLAKFQIVEGMVMENRGRTYCWVKMNRDGSIVVPEDTLKRFGVSIGDRVLSVRGSSIALGFLVREPIIEEAKKYSNIDIHE